jgi:hypothetical protein
MTAIAESIHDHLPPPPFEDSKEAGWIKKQQPKGTLLPLIKSMQDWLSEEPFWRYEGALLRPKGQSESARSQLDVVMRSLVPSKRPLFYTGKFFWATPHLNLGRVFSEQAPAIMVAGNNPWEGRFVELDGRQIADEYFEVENIAIRPFLRSVGFPERHFKEDSSRLVITTSLIERPKLISI